MKTTLFVILLVAASVLAAPEYSRLRNLFGKIRGRSLASITSPPATESEVRELSTGISNFGFDLFKAVSTPTKEGNIIFSPYSISSALGMVFAGAAGSTASQMKSSLQFTCPNVHGAFKEVNSYLLSNTDRERYVVKVANSLWGQSDYTFKQSFVELVRENYRSELKSVNFENRGQEAKKSINEGVDQKTNGKIKEFLTQAPASSTKLMLVNAIYFNALWQNPFNQETVTKSFRLLSGESYDTTYMTSKETSNFFEDTEKGYLALSIPYKQYKAYMTIILPEEGKFHKIKDSFNLEFVRNILRNFESRTIALTMPKFQFESQFKLKDALRTLGITDAFIGGEANFSEIDGTRNLAISDVIHKTVIGVDQKGTEVAAATAIPMYLSMEHKKIAVDLNRPFMFVIHNDKATMLFMGQFTEPERAVRLW